MNLFRSLLLSSILVGGCTSLSPLGDCGGGLPTTAADGSLSPISQEQSWAIAKATLAKREGWPEGKLGTDGLIHTIAHGSRRINNGGWRVVAHRAVAEVGHGDCGYDPIPAAVLIINNRGIVTHYVKRWTQ